MNTPRICYYVAETGFIEGRGYPVSLVKEGEPGHSPQFHVDVSLDKANAAAAEKNRSLGLSERDVMAIVSSSMVGTFEDDDVVECDCGEKVPEKDWDDHDCYWVRGEAHHAQMMEDDH